MNDAEARLREIQLALEYCELDYEDILEDYRDHLEVKRKEERKKNRSRLFVKQKKCSGHVRD